MSFGYRDEDWVDPDEDPTYFVSKCEDCNYCEVHPDNSSIGYCTYYHDWVEPREVAECNYDCFEGFNTLMQEE